VVFDLDLPDVESELRGADYLLRGELHPRGPEVEGGEQVAPEGPHPAVGVADSGVEEEVQHAGQERIADVAVQSRHRAGM
jgi:hypothetical protein